MQLGHIAVIEHYQDNLDSKVHQVKEVDTQNDLSINQNHKNVVEGEEKTPESKALSNISKEKLAQLKEYKQSPVANVSFGYNTASEDFFVRVLRGKVKNQYPTDDMMRAKAYLISLGMYLN